MIKNAVLCKLEQHRGTRFSGEHLARELGVSRAAVWKAIEALRAEGLQIESVPGGGYCLMAQDDSLTVPAITAHLHTKTLGKKLLVFPEITSTNTVLKQDYAVHESEGFTLIAEQQSAGRGRLGRTFCSPPGSGLYMSILLRPQLSLDRLNFITIAAAVAVCRAIEKTCHFTPSIKWVNDILMQNKKLCGILTEASIEGETGTIDFVVVGIGINVYSLQDAVPEDMRAIAGALSDFTDTPPRRAVLAAYLLNELESIYHTLQTEGTLPLIETYRTLLCGINQPIRVTSPQGSYDAICRGVDEHGHLLAELPSRQIQSLQSGEISIRLSI